MKLFIILLSAALMSCSNGGNSENAPDIPGHKNSGKLSDVPTYTNPITDAQLESFKDFAEDFEELRPYMDAQTYDNGSYKGCNHTETMDPPNSENYSYQIKVNGNNCAISYEDNGVYNSSSVQSNDSYKSNFSTSSNGVFKVENSSKLTGNLIATIVTDNSNNGEVSVKLLPNGEYNYTSTVLVKGNMRSTDLVGREVITNGAFYMDANSEGITTNTFKFSFVGQNFQVTLLVTMTTEENKSKFDKISLNGKDITEEELNDLIKMFSELKNQSGKIKSKQPNILAF
ncbi:MAG: hypothetical protein VX642_03090 [Bdellovibrionota bacterium]|nr:hypothetical protein [Bdellovibrionota bacterium]